MSASSLSGSLRLATLKAFGVLFPARIPTILMYHSVTPNADHYLSIDAKSFDEQLAFLRDSNSTFVPLNSLVQDLRDGKPIPPSAVAITFDDGYRDNLQHAVPVLEKYGAPATIYIATSFVELGHSPHGIPICSKDEIRELVSNPHISIGAHTHDHRKLTQLTSPEAEEDIKKGRAILENIVGQPVRHFAYPKGACTPELGRMVEKLGFESGVTVKPGWINGATNRMLLPRVAVDKNISPSLFKQIYCEAFPRYEVLKARIGL